MILMNDRTSAMFADDAAYPYFVEGEWWNVDPGFTNNADKVNEWIRFIVSNSTPGDPNGGGNMPWWRTNMATDDKLVMPDWPPLADLTYSDATLKTGAVNNYPVGDLNWYPELKSRWNGSGEAGKLVEALKAGELPVDWAGVGIEPNEVGSESFSALTAYPNPFTEMTNVRYEISKGSSANLVVYNILGERVRVIDLGYRSAGTHEFTFDKGNLNPGMYILQLNTDYSKAGLTTKISIR